MTNAVRNGGRLRLTLLFAIGASFIMLVAATVLGQIESRIAQNRLSIMAESNNAALTRAFANSVWRGFSNFVDTAHARSADDLRADPNTARMHAALEQLMDGTPVIKAKIYDLGGLTVFSTDPAQIGGDYSADRRFLAARGGGTASALEFKEAIVAFDGKHQNRWVLSSYVPVRLGGAGAAIEGIAELYSDVTEQEARRRATGRQLEIVVGLCFGVVLLLLIGIVWRADRTIQRQHQRTLDLAAGIARAEAAAKAKTTFLTNMSHEFRTPLTAVIGFAEIIRAEKAGPLGSAKYKEYAQDICMAGRHLLDIVKAVLELVKVEAGRMPVDLAAVDVGATAADVVKLMSARAAERGVRIVLEAGGSSGAIESDQAKLRQIVFNLLANAIEFTPKGGTVTVRLLPKPQRGTFSIAVRDTGIGMKEEDIPLALAPFGQIDSGLDRRHEGLGLGLPLSLQLARLLGGDLAIESQLGAGTTVTLTVPYAAPAEQAIEQAHAA